MPAPTALRPPSAARNLQATASSLPDARPDGGWWERGLAGLDSPLSILGPGGLHTRLVPAVTRPHHGR